MGLMQVVSARPTENSIPTNGICLFLSLLIYQANTHIFPYINEMKAGEGSDKENMLLLKPAIILIAHKQSCGVGALAHLSECRKKK